MIKKISPYLITLLIFYSSGLIFLIQYGYINSFLRLNELYTYWGDCIFPHLTHLGDSLWIISFLLIFCFRRNPALVITGIVSILLSGLIVLVLKNKVFYDWDRPVHLLGRTIVHHFEGLTDYHYSFPSGHSTAISAAGGGLAAMLSRRDYQVSIALMVLLIAYSRIYLGNHFLGDVLAGLLLGTTTCLFLLSYFYPIVDRGLKKREQKINFFMKILRFIGILGMCLGIYARYFSGHRF